MDKLQVIYFSTIIYNSLDNNDFKWVDNYAYNAKTCIVIINHFVLELILQYFYNEKVTCYCRRPKFGRRQLSD